MEPTNKCCKKLKYFCGPLRTIYDKNSDQTVKSQDQLAKYLKMASPFYNFRHGRKMVKKRLLFSENIQCSNFGCGKLKLPTLLPLIFLFLPYIYVGS